MAEYADIPYLGPPRWYGNWRTDKKYVAIHNTSNDATARGEASYATRREDSTSSHYYVDSAELVQSLSTDLVAWHAGNQEGNTYAIAYEITGVNGWTRQQWLDRVAWGLLARQIARDCRKHSITPRWLTIDQMRAGNVTGLVTHDDMRLAWGGTDHTDPGPAFPKDHLLALVQREMTGDDDMNLTDRVPAAATPDVPNRTVDQVLGDLWRGVHLRMTEQLQSLSDRLAALEARPPAQSAPVDPAVVDAAVAKALSNPDVLAAVAKAVNDEHYRRQAG